MLDQLTGWVNGLLGRKTARPYGVSGDVAAQLATFEDALRAVSPDFERYGRLAGELAAEAGVRSIYASLPVTGKVSRTAVAREFLVRLADEDDDEADAETLSQISDRQLAIVARRAGVPI
ncbi:MAG: hypothetical protein ACR2NO_04080 [Chloroflexota bacterium]